MPFFVGVSILDLRKVVRNSDNVITTVKMAHTEIHLVEELDKGATLPSCSHHFLTEILC